MRARCTTCVSLTVDVELSKKHVGAEQGYGFVQDVRVLRWVLCNVWKKSQTMLRWQKERATHDVCIRQGSIQALPACGEEAAALMGGITQPHARSKFGEEKVE